MVAQFGNLIMTHYEGLIDDLEKVQERAARFVTRNYIHMKKGS